MSTTVDQRVLEMKFDNKQFESNCATTMSTLDKLKQKLHLPGASKGLEDVGNAAKKVDMSGLSNGVETVKAKFSALDVIGVTALANITNSAVNAGKRIVSALTIDPVKAGFNEYELKMDSVRTIMASTGESIETVNEYLEELNEYSDQTIYSFSDMTQNIGKFTNAGVKLEDAVLAIKGISNAAALSGANANEAARSMYNFAQALSVGYIQRIDWKSIELANMATVEFKEQLLNSAIAAGTVKKNAQGMYETLAHPGKAYNAAAMFTETLDDQWLTTEVLIGTLKDYSDATTDIGARSYEAATKVTKLSQMFDVLKETAQSGWAKTWEIIFGNLEQAKAIFTPLTEFFSNIIQKMDDWRNGILEGGLGKSFSHLLDNFANFRDVLGRAEEAVQPLTNALEDLDAIATRVIRGEYGRSDTGRFEKLAEEGYNYMKVQNRVNEMLNNGFRYSEERIAAEESRLRTQNETVDATVELANATDKLSEADKARLVTLMHLDDEQLKALGYSEDQISSIRELTRIADELGQPIERFIDSIENIGDLPIAKKLDSFLYPAQNAVSVVRDLTQTVGDFDAVVKQVIRGEWGRSDTGRFEKLAEAGYNYMRVQNKVNEELGNGFRYSEERIAAEDERLRGLATTTGDVADNNKKLILTLAGLTDAQLRSLGYNDDQIASLRELTRTAERLGLPLEEFLDNLDKINGRWLLMRSFSNIGKSISKILTSIGRAWTSVFPPASAAESLFNAIAGFHKLSTKLVMTDRTAANLTRIFKGLFAAIDIILTVVGGPIKLAFKLLTKILSLCGFTIGDVFEVLGNLGDGIVKLRDWIDGAIDSFLTLTGVTEGVKKAVEAVKNWINTLRASTEFNDALNDVAKGFRGILSVLKRVVTYTVELFASLKGSNNIPRDLIAGFVNGIKKGIPKIGKAMLEMGKAILDTIKAVLGIHSPSKEMEKVGGFTMEGLLEGLKNGALAVWNFIKNAAKKIIDMVTNLDLGGIIFTVLSGGIVFALVQTALAFSKIAKGFGGIMEGLEGIGGILTQTEKAVKRVSKAVSMKLKAEAFKTFATAIAILVGSIVVLTLLDPKKVWISVGVIAALAGILFILSAAVGKLGAANVGKLSGMLLSMGTAMLLVSFAVKILDGISWGGLGRAAVGMMVFGGVIAGLVYITKLGGTPARIAATSKMVRKFSTALLLMSISMRILGGMSWGGIGRAVAGMIVFGGVVAGFIALTKYGGTPARIANAQLMVSKFATAFLMVAIAAKIIAGISWTDLGKAGAGILAFGGIIAGLMLMTKFVTTKDIGFMATIISKVGTCMLLMAIVVRIIGGIPFTDFLQGVAGIAAFGAVIAGLMWATKLVSTKDIAKIGGTLMGIAGAMFIMALTAKIVGGMSLNDFLCGIGGIIVFGVLVVTLIKVVGKIGPSQTSKIALTLLGVSVAIGILAAISVLLGWVKEENLKKGIAAVTILSVMMAILLKASSGATRAHKPIYAMAVAIGIMAVAVAALSFIDPTKLAGATAALTILIGMFSLLVFVTKFMNTTKEAMVMLIMLTGVVIALAYVVKEIAKLDSASALPNCAALSMLLLAMSGALAILSVLKIDKGIAKSIIALTAMVVPLAAFAFVLSKMRGVKNAKKNVTALTIFTSAMTVLLAALSVIGKYLGKGMVAGIVGLLALAVPLVAFVALLAWMDGMANAERNAITLATLVIALSAVLAILSGIGHLVAGMVVGLVGLLVLGGILAGFVGILAWMEGLQNAEANAAILIGLLTTLTKILVILTIVGPLALIGVAALSGLTLLMVGVGALAVGIGALMEKFPQLEEFLNKGIPILERLASGLGTMIGNFVGGIFEGLSNSLPAIGENLSAFMEAIGPFLEGAKNIDDNISSKIGGLAMAIVKLTGADLLANIASFLTGGSTFAQLGTDLSEFMTNITPFIEGASGINPDIMAGVQALADTILLLSAANILEGIASLITGESSLAKFGSQLPQLGSDLKGFVDSLGEFSDTQVTTVGCASNAIKKLAEAADAVPNTGGLWQKIAGESGLAGFSGELPKLGTNMKKFGDNLGTFGETQVDTVDCAANAIKLLATAADEIPNEDGLWQLIVGSSGLSSFSGELPKLGANMKKFGDNLGEFGETQVDTVDCAANAIKLLATAADEIPREDGVWQFLAGSNGLSTFSGELPKLGTNMKKFADNLGEFGTDQISTVNSAVRAIKAFIDFGNVDFETLASHMPGFCDLMVSLSTAIPTFCDKMPSSDSVSSAISTVDKICGMADEISVANASVVNTFASALSNLGNTGVSAFVAAFTGEATKMLVTTAAGAFVANFIASMTAKNADVKTASQGVAAEAVSGLSTLKSDAESAGKDFGSGLVAGINAKKTVVYNAAYALGQKAVQGEKDGQKSNSPSKLTILAGKWLGEGLVIGMNRMGQKVYNAGSRMGEVATDTISSAVSTISDMVSSDIDTQPTIRPVLDLSNVKSGAGAIGSMFNTASVGVRANVGAISTMMSQNGRGGTDDVVSAIDKLSRSLTGMPRGDTYQVNGVTYDDGSNVTNAIAEIVRHARIERRR